MKTKLLRWTLPMLAVAGIASATDLPKEGSYNFVTCWTRQVTRMEYAPGKAGWSYDERGTAVSEPKGGMFDGDELHCVGSSMSLDGKFYGNSLCMATAPDGSTRASRVWYGDDNQLKHETVGGTGRYEGLALSGTIQTTKPPPPPQPGSRTVEYCNRNAGTYKIK